MITVQTRKFEGPQRHSVIRLSDSIAHAKQELEDLKGKRRETFLFINRFSGSI